MSKSALALLWLTMVSSGVAAQPRVPTLDELVTLKTVGGTEISPDGKWVAYTVSHGDFKQDAFITHIWLANTDTGKSIQLTRGEKSSTAPRWSPDGQWLAFLSNRRSEEHTSELQSPCNL